MTFSTEWRSLVASFCSFGERSISCSIISLTPIAQQFTPQPIPDAVLHGSAGWCWELNTDCATRTRTELQREWNWPRHAAEVAISCRAAPYDGNLLVTSTLGAKRCFLSSLRMSFRAVALARLVPHYRQPATGTYVCPGSRSLSRPCARGHLVTVAADAGCEKAGPNLTTYRRIVS
jgi:hypothetical protein